MMIWAKREMEKLAKGMPGQLMQGDNSGFKFSGHEVDGSLHPRLRMSSIEI